MSLYRGLTVQHFIGEIFGIPENVPRFLKNVFLIPDERQLGLASLGNHHTLLTIKFPSHIAIVFAHNNQI